MHGIDLTPIWGFLNEMLVAVLAGLAGYIVIYIKAFLSSRAKFLDAQTVNQLGEVVQRTANNAVAYAVKTAETGEAQIGPITTGNRIGDIAANYMIRHIPDTLDKLGKSPGDISDMILAKLPPTPATTEDTTGVTIRAPVSIEVKPLPSVGGEAEGK